MLPQMITNVVTYEPRNVLIIHEVMQYAQEAGRQVMIISDRIQHLHHLKELIDDIILKGTITSTAKRKLTTGLYTGQQKQKELNVSEKADIIFSSYAMCREGLDIQSLNTIVLATSTGDVVQTCGRILRKEHAVSPLVIDIVDNFSTFVGQSKKRNIFYKKSEYAVHSMDYTVSNTPCGLDILKLSSTNLAKLVKMKPTTTMQVIEHESGCEDEDLNIKSNSAYAFLQDDDD
jgi:superfamily II DNA or RNA helicase